MKLPIRIAVLHFSHETVTFLANDTTLADFIYPGSPAAGEALLTSDPRGYMGGFVKMAREFEAVELIGIESRFGREPAPAPAGSQRRLSRRSSAG